MSETELLVGAIFQKSGSFKICCFIV